MFVNNMLFFVIFIIFVGLSNEEKETTKFVPTIKYEDNIAILTAVNFKAMMEKFENVLVEFYSPSCGHCEQFGIVYSNIAKKFEKEGKLGFGKISCKKYPKFTEPFKIIRYPTVLYFHKGKVIHEYDGNRTEPSLNEYLETMQKFLEVGITNKDEMEYVKTNFTKIAIYFGDKETNIQKIKAISMKVMFAICKDKEIMKSENANENSLVLYKEFDERRNDLVFNNEIEINEENVNKFIKMNAKAFYKPYTSSLFLRIYAFKEPAFIMFGNCSEVGNDTCKGYEKMVGDIAKKMYENEINGKLSKEEAKENQNFIYTFFDLSLGGFEKYLSKKVNIGKETKLPVVKLLIGKEIFGYQGEIKTEKIVNDFLMKYFKNQLIPVEKKVDL